MYVYHLYIISIYVANRILASLIHNNGLYSKFPNVFIALRMFMCLMVSNIIVPVNVRSVEWRYNALLWQMSACPALEFLSIESDLLDNIHVYFHQHQIFFYYGHLCHSGILFT